MEMCANGLYDVLCVMNSFPGLSTEPTHISVLGKCLENLSRDSVVSCCVMAHDWEPSGNVLTCFTCQYQQPCCTPVVWLLWLTRHTPVTQLPLLLCYKMVVWPRAPLFSMPIQCN